MQVLVMMINLLPSLRTIPEQIQILMRGEVEGGMKKEGFPGLFIDTGGQIVTPAYYKDEKVENGVLYLFWLIIFD